MTSFFKIATRPAAATITADIRRKSESPQRHVAGRFGDQEGRCRRDAGKNAGSRSINRAHGCRTGKMISAARRSVRMRGIATSSFPGRARNEQTLNDTF
jgi:hypothetical protein